jgi:hypothetical protein
VALDYTHNPFPTYSPSEGLEPHSADLAHWLPIQW